MPDSLNRTKPREMFLGQEISLTEKIYRIHTPMFSNLFPTVFFSSEVFRELLLNGVKKFVEYMHVHLS